MKINFAMWRKASWELIKMDDKKEWDALDVVSKWLIATLKQHPAHPTPFCRPF